MPSLTWRPGRYYYVCQISLHPLSVTSMRRHMSRGSRSVIRVEGNGEVDQVSYRSPSVRRWEYVSHRVIIDAEVEDKSSKQPRRRLDEAPREPHGVHPRSRGFPGDGRRFYAISPDGLQAGSGSFQSCGKLKKIDTRRVMDREVWGATGMFLLYGGRGDRQKSMAAKICGRLWRMLSYFWRAPRVGW